MPESPEVQALVEILDERLVGRTITAVELEEFRALKTRQHPLDELVGATVTGVRRYGKHVDLETDGRHLVISFGRAGWAVLDEDTDAAPIARVTFGGAAGRHDRAVLTVTDAGSWLSLGLSVVATASEVSSISKLGPDPIDPSYAREQLDAVLGGRRKQLKALLQEQESLSGIGGAYSDEILHVAKLSPVAHAADLDDDERARLFAAVRSVLTEAVAARRGIPLSQQKAAKVAAMRVHGRTGQACPVCGGTVRDVPGSKGAAQYCPTCQTGGVPIPDPKRR